jgi:tetratricopeptide (TPR) repeat protein
MDATLSDALKLHLAGRYADAARRYHNLLIHEPEDADALHLFGLMHHECGHSSRAAELIGRAVTLRPETAAYHANLAEVHRKLGGYEQAVECCRRALCIQPEYPEAANNLGLALQALGRKDPAVEMYRAAVRMRPGFALAHNNLGVMLRDMGRDHEALEAFRAAVVIDSTLAIARANLGQALVDAGEAGEGLSHCLEAVRLQPELAAAHNNLGSAYVALGRRSDAIDAYAEALRLSPELGGAKIHANLGLALQREGQFAKSLCYFRRAVERDPGDVQLWRHLANAYAGDEDYASAIACCERVVALEPGQPQSHIDLGGAMLDDNRLEEAGVCFRRALELQPDSLEGLLQQGGLHAVLGELAEAEGCYRRAREAHPDAPAPLTCLANLLRGRLPVDDCEAVCARLEDRRIGDGPRANLLFGLAHTWDETGQYAQAAACAEQANALALRQRRDQHRDYDAAEHARFVDQLIAGFTAERFSRLAGGGNETRQPVFVFGLPRSGTTLVEQVLAGHPGVHGAGELRLARQTFEAIPAAVGRDDGMLPCIAALNVDAVDQLARRYREALQEILDRIRPGFAPDRVVDKMPDNYLYLGLISILFPCATLIYVRRDPRDVALSCWMTNFRTIRWANDPEHLAQRIREHHRLIEHWRSVLPASVHEVHYERLVDNFEAEARRLVADCGLDWEPACLRFHSTTRPVRTASVTQVRQRLYHTSLARWKHYEGLMVDLFGRVPRPRPVKSWN